MTQVETSKLIDDIYAKIRNVSASKRFTVGELVFELPSLDTKETFARLYSGRFGEGQTPILIYVPNKEMLTFTEHRQHLVMMSDKEIENLFQNFYIDKTVVIKLAEIFEDRLKEYFFSKRIKRCAMKYDAKEIEDILSALKDLNEKQGIFYTTTFDISKLKQIKLTQDEINTAVDLFLTRGYEIDDRIKFAFDSSVFIPNTGLIDSDRYVKYNDNSIVFTSPKVGKSYIAERVGIREDDLSPAGLLGFSTADETHYGLLHRLAVPFAFDEVTSEKRLDILSKLLSLMELGKVSISKGKRTIECECWANMRFLGNPTEDAKQDPQYAFMSDEEFLLNTFSSMLEKISANASAFGSRIALIIYNIKIKSVRGIGLDDNQIDKLKEIYDIIRELSKNKFTELFKDREVQLFLAERNDEYYEKTLTELAASQELLSFSKIRNFILGSIDANKHVNGMALKLALRKQHESLIYSKLDMQQLFEDARHSKMKILQMNLDSFINLKATVKEKFRVKQLAHKLKSMGERKQRFICAIKDMPDGEYNTEDIDANKFQNEFNKNKRSKKEIIDRLYEFVQGTNDDFREFGVFIYEQNGERRFRKKEEVKIQTIIDETIEKKQLKLTSDEK
jgi:hypothetical protein